MFTRDISQVTQIGDMYESSDEGSQEADIYLHPLSKVVSRAEHIAAQMLYKGLGGSLGAWPARIFQGGITGAAPLRLQPTPNNYPYYSSEKGF
jgi:hypothetical protein